MVESYFTDPLMDTEDMVTRALNFTSEWLNAYEVRENFLILDPRKSSKMRSMMPKLITAIDNNLHLSAFRPAPRRLAA